MNARVFCIIVILLHAVLVSRLHAATDEQLSSIEQLGQLNGVALQCKYFAQTRKIKQALVVVLPKQRQLGQVFEAATNQSFLDLLKDGTGCPGEEILAGQVGARIEALHAAFPK